jgi:hypothetical protein
MHVAFVQSGLPPLIRAGALVVMIGGLSACGRVGEVSPVAANGEKLDSSNQKQIQQRLNITNSRYTVGGSRDARPVLEHIEQKLTPELVD